MTPAIDSHSTRVRARRQGSALMDEEEDMEDGRDEDDGAFR
jgi:hypothetical protein